MTGWSKFMRLWRWIVYLSALASLVPLNAKSEGSLSPDDNQVYPVKGVIEEIRRADASVTIKCGAISNFMAAMTMPYFVKDKKELEDLRIGDEISFQLHVTDTDSWIGGIIKTGTRSTAANVSTAQVPLRPVDLPSQNPLLAYKFTNELGQAVSFDDFHGQALAITFFYTRCPLPDFCPRLSKNFEETEKALESMTNAPSNWHLISVSFDTDLDSPEVLKNYGETYEYDPKHWSFLTGPPEKIAELAHAAGVHYDNDGTTISHNIRTLIIDASGHLQMIFPVSGDFSSQIVSQLIKAASATNVIAARNQEIN